MDAHGFLTPRPCERCGKPLHGEGTGYPAELYAGTFTGLCYPCTSAAPFATGDVEPSGAVWWDHPPSCPSHRRDRERYLAFEDCPRCHGKGAAYVSRSFGAGGGYYTQCAACSERHEAHETIKARREVEARQRAAYRVWQDRMNAEFRVRLAAAGLLEKPEGCTCGAGPLGRCRLCIPLKPQIDAIAAAVLAEGPKALEGETVPEFPPGWAGAPLVVSPGSKPGTWVISRSDARHLNLATSKTRENAEKWAKRHARGLTKALGMTPDVKVEG